MTRLPKWATVLFIALAPGLAAQSSERDSIEVPVTVCGLSFKITRDWVASPGTKDTTGLCTAELRSKNYDRKVGMDDPVHFWKIAIDVQPKPFDQLADFNDIKHEGDRWFVGEGARQAPAYEIKGPGWWGLKVDELSIRSSSRRDNGSFESQTTWVAAASGNQTAYFLAGDGTTSDALPLLLSTLKFAGSNATTVVNQTGASLQGVWRTVEITITGPAPRTITVPDSGPYLTIFTKQHYSRTEIQSEGPRPIIPDVAKATADELRAVWGPLVAEAGTYELGGNRMTVHPFISKNPAAMGPNAVILYDYKLDTALWLTQVRNQNGPYPNPVTFKLVRVE